MSTETRLDELLSLWQVRQAQGDDVPATELCRDCPELLPEVERRLDALRRMHQMAQTGGLLRTAPTVPVVPGQSSAPPPNPDGYEILGELGRGGMGVVYKARQQGLNRLVALKMVLAAKHAGVEQLARFRTEAEAVARLHHPNIVQIYEIGERDGLPFLSLEFLEGGSLQEKLNGTPMRPEDAARMVESLARAIHAAHQAGIVHRDLKPGNILVDRDGTLKITDFGLAKQLDEDSAWTRVGDIIGTPSYMAPEQATGQAAAVGPACDVYALGAILYECLTGRPPFRGATPHETVEQVRSVDPVPPSRLVGNLPRDLETICLHCLRKDPAGRYGTAEALAADLAHFLRKEPILARPVGRLERTVKWVRRRPALAAAYGLVVLAVVLGGVGGSVTWLWQRSEQAREQLASEKRESEAARREADSARIRLAEVSYLHRTALAYREWEDADVARAEELLESCPLQLRGWEWRYVSRLCHAELRTLTGHRGGVTTVAFSPDGKHLATASEDYTVKVWDTETGQETLTCRGHAATVSSVAFSPDGKWLASGSADRTVKIWDARTGQATLTLKGHTGPVLSVAVSPDGRRLASGSNDRTVKVWDAQTGEELLALKGHTHYVNGVAYSRDGRLLASASSDRTVKVWDAQSGRATLTLTGHTGAVHGVAFRPDGRLATASEDRTVNVWDPQTGQLVRTLFGHTDIVHRVTFSPDGKHVASASLDQTARVWDATTGQEVASHKGHIRPVLGVAFSHDGARLATASADGTVKVWRAVANARGASLQGHTNAISEVKISPDGRTVAGADWDGMVRVWDVGSQRQVLCIRAHAPAAAGSVAFSPDGHRLVSGGNDRLVKVWYTKTGEQALCLTGHTAAVQSVAFSPDGTRLASGSGSYDKEGNLRSGEAKIWDAHTGRELFTLRGEREGLNCVAFSPDGKRVVCGGDRGVSVWDAGTGRQLLSLRGHTDSVVCVAFSPDGERLASASYDRTVKLWHAATGEAIWTFAGHTARVTCVTFSPDGQRLASGGDDRRVRLVVASTGEEAFALKGTLVSVHSVAFSPDGNLLVSGGWDRLLRIWDGRPVGRTPPTTASR